VIAVDGSESKAVLAKLKRVFGGMRGIRFEGEPHVPKPSTGTKVKVKSKTHVLAVDYPTAEQYADGGIAEEIADFFAK